MIYIVGAGAIGQALAVMLHHADKKVMLIRRVASAELTIRVELGNERLEAIIPVGTLADINDGTVLITAKSFANPAIAEKLKAGKMPVVLLQNGLNIEAPFKNAQLYRCVLLVTSQFGQNGVVQFKPVSACPIGTIRGNNLTEIVKEIDTPWFRFEAVPDIRPRSGKRSSSTAFSIRSVLYWKPTTASFTGMPKH